ncbi:unnamed protein product, partial [Effrenium voratum]
MTCGVGRGTIFNHRDPLHNKEDLVYLERCVDRFRLVLASGERKLFVMMNLNHQLWIEQEGSRSCVQMFVVSPNPRFLVLDCKKNLGFEA